jgi:linoleoyl-CoA desaturase
LITTAPRFNRKSQQDFSRMLKKRVNAYFDERNIKRTGDWRIAPKAIAVFGMYFGPYLLFLFADLTPVQFFLCWLIMGVGVAGIGLGIMHEANHGSLTGQPWLNKLFGYSLNLIGGNSLSWRIQHNVLHHSFTNVHGIDEDLEGGHIMRFTPKEPWKKHHRLQHIYAWALYSLMTFSWVLLKDFKRLKKYNDLGLVKMQNTTYAKAFLTIAVSKVIYLTYIIAMPLIVGYSVGAVLLGFVFMHLIAGLLLAMIFQPAHVIESHEFHHATDAEINQTYESHQLNTTSNFAPNNKLLTWYCGGLNYQIEHHIFPSISHVHYPEISKIVRATAEEFGLPYRSAGSFRDALRIHQRTMKKLGTPEFV